MTTHPPPVTMLRAWLDPWAPRLDLSSPTGLLGRAGGPEETTVRSAVQVQIT